MIDPALPEDVQTFLRDHIESYEQLDILILLRAHPDRSWAPGSMASTLRTTEASAEEAARFLCREGLLTVRLAANTLLFVYSPRSGELDELVKRLIQSYAEQRLEVMRLMTANAIDRLRTRSIRTFSEAFVLGRRKNKDG